MNVSGHKEKATFLLSREVTSRLDDAVPESERSRFVEDAILRALSHDARKSLEQFLDELPRETSGSESLADFLHRKRIEWDVRPVIGL